MRQKAIFFRGLSVLLNSGVHLLEAIAILSRQTEDPDLKGTLETVATRIARGQKMSDSMRMSAKAFDAFEIALIRVGEDTGRLHHVLERLSSSAEKRDELRLKVVSALTYPAFVFILCFLLLILAPIYVFKDLLTMLRELKVPLPLPTRLYLFFSDVISSPLFFILLAAMVGLAIWGTKQWSSQGVVRLKVEEGLLRVPGLGAALRNSMTAEYTIALAACYQAGLPILQAMELTRKASWSHALAERLCSATDDMKGGSTLATALSNSELFSPVHLSLLIAGEESGKVAQSLTDIAKIATEDTEHSLERAQSMLEPFVLLFAGTLVGFIAIAILGPMLKVVETI